MNHRAFSWVNTCVNFRNYKYFVQFLGYALLLCAFAALTDLQYFINFWTVCSSWSLSIAPLAGQRALVDARLQQIPHSLPVLRVGHVRHQRRHAVLLPPVADGEEPEYDW